MNLILDNKSIKVKSLNSFEDYINLHINYELRLNSKINVEYRDSKAGDAFNIQAVDYIANAVGSDRKSTRLNSSHLKLSRMPSSA